MSMLIEQVLSTAEPLSEYVNGQSLVPFSESGERKTAALQVIPVSDGSFEVHIEGAINVGGNPVFTKIGTYTQDSDSLMSIFEVAKSGVYRFRHISGVDVNVLMEG